MRKRIFSKEDTNQRTSSGEGWLDLANIAEVELTSEDPAFPIEGALILQGAHPGWRAAEPGEQVIRLVFDTPTSVRRIRLQFVETQVTRTQEFVLRCSNNLGETTREILRQQYNFSPSGSTYEIEDYHLNLEEVGFLELAIKADISGGDALASLAAWRIA